MILESPLDCKEIKPAITKGNQPWMFIGKTVTEAKAPRLWPPDGNSKLIGIVLNDRKTWIQKEKGVAEDEMVR